MMLVLVTNTWKIHRGSASTSGGTTSGVGRCQQGRMGLPGLTVTWMVAMAVPVVVQIQVRGRRTGFSVESGTGGRTGRGRRFGRGDQIHFVGHHHHRDVGHVTGLKHLEKIYKALVFLYTSSYRNVVKVQTYKWFYFSKNHVWACQIWRLWFQISNTKRMIFIWVR